MLHKSSNYREAGDISLSRRSLVRAGIGATVAGFFLAYGTPPSWAKAAAYWNGAKVE